MALTGPAPRLRWSGQQAEALIISFQQRYTDSIPVGSLPPQPGPRGDEPGAVKQRFAIQLGGQLGRVEVPLVDKVPGSVVQYSLLLLLGIDPRPTGRVDHDQLTRHPPGLFQKGLAFGRGKVDRRSDR